MNETTTIPGYTYGSPNLARSPITPDAFAAMKQSALFGDDDVRYLRMSADVVRPQVDAILDVWYGFVASTPHLVASFSGRDGQPIGDYLGAVRRRFGQWILDTAAAEYDQAWLDYQHEIALRHHRAKKNRTDGAASTPLVPFRDLFLLIVPVTTTLKPFLAAGGHTAADVDKMHAAWVKSCLLQVTLWSHLYVKDGDF
ncbi:MAG: protogloblin ApPgb [Acidobacteria bacterium]|nr:protogloblin ApPgb [Acidobacteriota bacterium]